MAKNDTNETGATALVDAPTPTPAPDGAELEMTLEEFCLRMSDRKVNGRIELIHGFAYTERTAGRIKDSESQFQARFKAFATKSV